MLRLEPKLGLKMDDRVDRLWKADEGIVRMINTMRAMKFGRQLPLQVQLRPESMTSPLIYWLTCEEHHSQLETARNSNSDGTQMS